MTSSLFSRGRLVALAVAIAVVPVTAGPADAAPKDRQKAKHAATKTVAKKRAAKKRQGTKPAAPATTPAPVATPTPAEPAFTSVISIGGYVFYNLTLAEAYDAYAAAVAAAPAGYTPPPVTSVSVTSTVSGSGS